MKFQLSPTGILGSRARTPIEACWHQGHWCVRIDSLHELLELTRKYSTAVIVNAQLGQDVRDFITLSSWSQSAGGASRYNLSETELRAIAKAKGFKLVRTFGNDED
jgi:hypothetical protein